MREILLQDLNRKLTLRYAYQKVVLNSRGEAEDYIFLNMNRAYEEMTGHKKENILGKRISEIFPGAKAGFDWVSFYGNVAMTGTTREIIRYIDALGCWSKITVFSPEQEYFVTVFQDITFEKAKEWTHHQKGQDDEGYKVNMIHSLLAPLFEKNPEAEEHAERVKEYCRAIAGELSFSAKETNELSLFAMLHDIGKVGIQPGILQKPSPLSPEEWQEMKRHPEIGYRIVRNTPHISAVAEYILSHHERWDGLGYPRGLKGKNIPLMCHILAVADAYDAMTNDRVYRKALSREEALAELKRNAGTQFHREIVNLFIKIISRI